MTIPELRERVSGVPTTLPCLDVAEARELLDALEEAIELLNRMHYSPPNPGLVGDVQAFLTKHGASGD